MHPSLSPATITRIHYSSAHLCPLPLLASQTFSPAYSDCLTTPRSHFDNPPPIGLSRNTAKSVSSSLHLQSPKYPPPSMKVKPTSSRRSSDAYHPYPPPASPHSFAEPDLPNRHTPAGASAPGGDEQQYKVARAISSCTRCRQRKQKCDGKLPACTACERAKVECIGFDAISKTNISRK